MIIMLKNVAEFDLDLNEVGKGSSYPRAGALNRVLGCWANRPPVLAKGRGDKSLHSQRKRLCDTKKHQSKIFLANWFVTKLLS